MSIFATQQNCADQTPMRENLHLKLPPLSNFMQLWHRYLNKSRMLKFWHLPATSTWSFKGILGAPTEHTNKAGGMCH